MASNLGRIVTGGAFTAPPRRARHRLPALVVLTCYTLGPWLVLAAVFLVARCAFQ